MRRIDYIVVHCSATIEGLYFDVSDIDAWHKKRGWSGIGYHYAVLLDGKVQKGRPETQMGAHVKGHNKNSIGVCYIGGLGKDLAPKDTRTGLQKESLLKLLKQLKNKYPKAKILGHRDFSEDLNNNGIIEPFEFSKSCPCFDAYNTYKNL